MAIAILGNAFNISFIDSDFYNLCFLKKQLYFLEIKVKYTIYVYNKMIIVAE